jgi:hypothetical protein
MDPFLTEAIDEAMPKLNRQIIDGIARRQMQIADDYLNDIWKGIAKEFPKDLTYDGFTPCLPREHYLEETKKKEWNLARHDMYVNKYHFSYQGRKLKDLYIALPFITKRNTMYMGNARYYVAPVLSDPIISVTLNSIFVRLSKAKNMYYSEDYRMKVNGVQDTCPVVWSKIHNGKSNQGRGAKSVKISSSIAHYLFGKFGVSESFRRYARCSPVFGDDQTITEAVYPPSEWVICESSGMPNRGRNRVLVETTRIRIAVRREDWNVVTQALCVGFYYVIDHFPDHQFSLQDLDNKDKWRVMLGCIIWSGNEHHGRLLAQVDSHYQSLDNYMDSIGREKFRMEGLAFEDYYDFLGWIVGHYKSWYMENESKINSMYDKELSVVYYVLYKLTHKMFTMSFDLTKLANKELTDKKIEETMKAALPLRLLRSVAKDTYCFTAEQTSGDNPAFKLATILIPQDKAFRQDDRNKKRGGKKGKNADLNNPTKALHVSVAEVGGYLNLPKAEPSGRSRLNPFVQMDERFMVLRSEKFRATLDRAQEVIAQT